MLITEPKQLTELKSKGLLLKNQVRPTKVLQVTPEHFRVEYAINPFMKNEKGELNVVDEARAREEWKALNNTYRELGCDVSELKGAENQPDMVFAANQSFPFQREGGPKEVVLSEMRSEFRRGEVKFFEEWYKKAGYQVHRLNNRAFFEGNGDALVQYPYNLIWGGYGHRSSLEAYEEISERFGFHVVPIELNRDAHYHLDLCLSIINESTAVCFPEAFSEKSLEILRLGFPNLIEVSEEENLRYACCNCHSPDGKHVISQKGAERFFADVKKKNLVPVPVATDEFIKSGGSVFCMKMMVF